MPLDQVFLDLLQCPQSGRPLVIGDSGALADDEGQHTYPWVSGMPWLLPHPRNSLLDWGAKLNHFQQVLLHEIAALGRERASVSSASDLTRGRLDTLLTHKRAFLSEVTQLLAPMVSTRVAAKAVYDALRDRAPSTQNLLSYEANIYRDWIWGDEENALTADLVQDCMDGQPGRLFVPGAGAGRLAVDIHRRCKPDCTVISDINPLFVLALEKLLAGESFSLCEFPLQPKNLDCVALQHRFQALDARPENLYLSFADVSRPAFKPAAFDTVLTPWLIDIQAHELGAFLRQINHYLPVGGCWLNFGSLVFNQGRDALCYSQEEIAQIAQLAGFDIEKTEQAQIPYLKSPYNAGHRVETVWAWRARKLADVTNDEALQNLPKWLLNTSASIPVDERYAGIQSQSAFLAELFSKVDGRRSIDELAQHFAQRDVADEDEIKHLLLEYFQRFCAQ